MFVAISSQTSEQSVGICLTLLGGFSIWLGAQEISEADFSRRKARSLLKLIALQPAYRLSRDQAMDLLWPDLAPRGAAAQLYKALHYIRQAFAAAQPSYPPEAVLDLHNEILTLDAPGGVHTDVEAFETLAQEATGNRDLVLLQRAVASYGGDLLPADLYEEWTLERREALRERFMDLLVRLGEVYLASQHLPEAAEAFRRALARDPAHEAAHRGLMRAFAFQGYHTRALRQYRLCQDALARELDVAPSEETVRLYEEIRQGKIQPLQVATSSSVTEPAGLTLLVGRQNETQVVNDLLNHLGRGRGAVLSLEGSAGIGKTRMAQEILVLGRRRGYLVLMGSAHEQEGCSPYTPIIDALRMALVTSQADADLIPAELAAAIPELAPVKPPAPNPDRVAAQAILFAGVLRFLSARARAMPLVLILDDLHAADEASLQLFHYLARHTSDRPLLLIGAWRSQEVGAGPDLRTLVASLERKGLARHLLLTPLSESEHRALLDLTLGQGNVDIRLAAEVYRLSAGNPLFAQEIVRQLAAAGEVVKGRSGWRLTGSPRRVPIPPSLQLLLAPRLAHLSPTTRHLLNVATVAGQEVPFSVLQATAGTASETLLVGLDEAIASRLLEESGMTYRFVHPLFREAIYQQMTQARRQELHGQVARALEAMYQDDPTKPIEAIAHHYLQVGDIRRAVRYLTEAGDRAEAVYAHDDALHRYGEALSLLEDQTAPELLRLQARVHQRVGDAYRAIGDVSHSLAAYQAALAVWTLLLQSRDGEEQAKSAHSEVAVLHRKIALGAILAADMPTAGEHLARARELLGNDLLEEARLLIVWALFAWHQNALEEAIDHALRALEIAEAAGARVEASQACEMLALSYLPMGNWEEGMKYELRRQVAGWSPDVVVATDGHLCLWEYHLHGDEPYRRAQEFIEAVAQHAATLGDLRCVAVCHYALGSMAFLRGLLEPATKSLAQALELHQRIGSPAGVAYVLARQANLWTVQGDTETGWALVQQGLEAARQAAVWDHCLQRVYGAGISNRLEAGDLAGAGEIVQAAQKLEQEGRLCTVCSVQMYPMLAAFYLASGDLQAALAYVEKTQRLAEMGHNRAGQAQALQMRGQVYTAQGEIAMAETCLAQAAEIFRELGQRHDLAQTLLVWSQLPAGNDPIVAQSRQTLLREALAIKEDSQP